MKPQSPANGPTWEAVLSYVEAGQVLAGVDEVGRGAWAGPVVAAAVVLPDHHSIEGLNDSKQLSPAARRRLDRQIRREAVGVGIGWVAAAEVDTNGLSWAVRHSGLRALAALDQWFDMVILDGKHNYLAGDHTSVAFVKGDALITPVAAASVVAKVARDRYLERLAVVHPGYGLEQHKGYGTAAHRRALDQLGATPAHRRTWGPFRDTPNVS